MAAQYGKDRVATLVFTPATADSLQPMHQLMIQAFPGKSMWGRHSNGSVIFVIAPIDDVSGLLSDASLGTVVTTNPATNTVMIDISSLELPKQPSGSASDGAIKSASTQLFESLRYILDSKFGKENVGTIILRLDDASLAKPARMHVMSVASQRGLSAFPGPDDKTVTIFIAPVTDMSELAKALELGKVEKIDAQAKTAWIDVGPMDVPENKR
jgi:hypothetical protein